MGSDDTHPLGGESGREPSGSVMSTTLLHPLGELPDDSKRRGAFALVVALLAHLAIYGLLPERIMPAHRVSEPREAVIYEISLVEPEAMRFVEVNPEAPENEPDRTEQYSFRAQQAADDLPLATADNAPRVDGEEASQKIIQGELRQSPPVAPGIFGPQAPPGEDGGTEGGKAGTTAQAAMPTVQPLPPPDFLKQEPVSESGPGSRIDRTAEAPEVVREPVPDAPIPVYRPQEVVRPEMAEGDGSGGAVAAQPRPRPRLAPELLTGPLMQSNSSASRRGALAIDASFSEFGEYEQQFYAAVQIGWYQEIEFFRPIDTGARVHVRFRMKADGTVDEVEAVETTASKVATLICETAITKRSPFRPWSREMIEVFGRERWINVVFHYR